LSGSIVVFVLSTILFLAGMLFLWWVGRHLHLGAPITVSKPDPDSPLISIIIPARDEARNIRHCIESLQMQTYPRWEMVVVNDHSTDGTPDIVSEYALKDPRISLLNSKPLPSDWVGKSHAMAQGADQATGDWLCFIDADTFASPELLASTFAEARDSQADLISILTTQELKSFWENVISSVAFSGCALVYDFDRINDSRTPDAMAIGQFILIRRKVYEDLGGHHTLHDSILEDRALAEMVKRAGHRILLKDGRGLARTRMYTSFTEIWEGWVKTIYPGMRDQTWMLLVIAGASILGACIFPLWWFAALGWWVLSGSPLAGLVFLEATVFWIYFLREVTDDMASFGISRWYALTVPVGLFIFAAMMLDSYFRSLTGHGLKWKGRTYQTK
jgi:chlorobactene glucosyltransferase